MSTQKRDTTRDSFDLRDLIYRPALVSLQDELYPDWSMLHILDQENQGACTGFGLAAVINYLNERRGRKYRVSARMLFEMARRYDQWPGESYDYSSPRGAMKGWHKHGVCSDKAWPNHPGKKTPAYLTEARQTDALKCPLGAYYRILPQRNDVHAALNEVGVVYAAAATHAGWDAAMDQPEIDYSPGAEQIGGHAFAIVGYTREGFLVQNSWGNAWGGFVSPQGTVHPGIALWRYADFERNVWDLWVARPALPVESLAALDYGRYAPASSGTRLALSGPPRDQIYGHYVHIDNGTYDERSTYDSHADDIRNIVRKLVHGEKGQVPKQILLYAHGGLNSVNESAARVKQWRGVLKENGVAELHFIWETGFLAEVWDILSGKEKQAGERVAGLSSWWDKEMERLTAPVGHALWNEMQRDARVAFEPAGAGTHFLKILKDELKQAGDSAPGIHLVGHSAGAIWMGHLLERWQALQGPAFRNLILFAPACTVEFFAQKIVPALCQSGGGGSIVQSMRHYYLDDQREQDDSVGPYRKSLLYLVSRAFQDRNKVVPVMGMEIYQAQVKAALDATPVTATVKQFNTRDNPGETASSEHGKFDNDPATMNSMLTTVLGADPDRRFEKGDLN